MIQQKQKILIVEDDIGLQKQLNWTFEDFEVLWAVDRESAIKMVKEEDPPVVTLDLGLPPYVDEATEGLAVLEEIRTIAPHAKVIIMTGSEDRAHALKAVAMGAYDFYQKPIDADTIRLIVNRAYTLYELENENRRLAESQLNSRLPGLITASPTMLAICSTVEKVAPASVSVLLLGESGVGKELVARALHELSPRAGNRFVAINCAAIPENLLESELFGHEKGSFTGAYRQVTGKIQLADQGTLFLDEIGDLSVALQSKLLRFLQDRKIERIGGRQEISVDVRVICATNQDPEELIKTGRFREDLYYRLSELVIRIPPLRERPGDPALLVHHFLNVYSHQNGRKLHGFTNEALAAIANYNWPGNVRELENRVKRAVIMAEGAYLTPADLDLSAPEDVPMPLRLREIRDRADREAVRQALVQVNGNITRAAKLLGISRPALYDLMRQHGFRI